MLQEWKSTGPRRIYKTKIFNFNKLKERQREMIREIVKRNGNIIDIWVHPYFRTEYSNIINAKAICDARKSKRPLFVFVEEQRYDILKKRFEEMGLKIPVVFVKTQLSGPQLALNRKEKRTADYIEDELDKDAQPFKDKRDAEKAKRFVGRLLNLGIRRANVFGELFHYDIHKIKPELIWTAGCVSDMIDMLNQNKMKRQSKKKVRPILDTTKTEMDRYYTE